MTHEDDKLIFDLSCPGRQGFELPEWREEGTSLPDELLRDTACGLPEVAETDVVRHYTRLSQKNYGVDEGFYPLGSCTMKYNPKINEAVAALEGFTSLHPLQPQVTAQGTLEMMFRLQKMLAEFAGLDSVTLQPAAGAHGELTGLMIMRAYHLSRGDQKRTKVIVPDSAHGTNPASTALAGMKVVEVRSDADGNVDIEALKGLMSDEIAGLMLTNPNTLGLFEKNILQIAEIVHHAGGLLYYDGANANAIAGVCRPGDMGFDIAHLNLHKTFSTPHGGGGPGSGPVAVRRDLAPFLPKPVVAEKDGGYALDFDRPLSIGKVRSFYGNIGVAIRAYAYLRTLGAEGLREVAQASVLNANYLRVRLSGAYDLPYDRTCKHEVVFAGLKDTSTGVTTGHVAKRLIDYGYHPPTVYFPLIVREAMMAEPTETESKETLDGFIDALLKIAEEAKDDPELVKSAPHTTPLAHLDETKAARTPILNYSQMKAE